MSDLRDRIVDIIGSYPVGEYQGGIHPEDVVGLADAVLHGLHMHEEHGRLKVTRYVTDWFIDE